MYHINTVILYDVVVWFVVSVSWSNKSNNVNSTAHATCSFLHYLPSPALEKIARLQATRNRNQAIINPNVPPLGPTFLNHCSYTPSLFALKFPATLRFKMPHAALATRGVAGSLYIAHKKEMIQGAIKRRSEFLTM